MDLSGKRHAVLTKMGGAMIRLPVRGSYQSETRGSLVLESSSVRSYLCRFARGTDMCRLQGLHLQSINLQIEELKGKELTSFCDNEVEMLRLVLMAAMMHMHRATGDSIADLSILHMKLQHHLSPTECSTVVAFPFMSLRAHAC